MKGETDKQITRYSLSLQMRFYFFLPHENLGILLSYLVLIGKLNHMTYIPELTKEYNLADPFSVFK
ncbi:MAG: hypothetical protein BWX62_00956 [Bacteroidetes bacterium ADurb.Bin037]|nr:MAG: hypothetical protein BWX62_00956 [Bacteroidetes bacterium ADurb.Bin037]